MSPKSYARRPTSSSLHTQGGGCPLGARVGAGRDPFSPQTNAQPADAAKLRLKVPPARNRGLSNTALRQQRCDSAVFGVRELSDTLSRWWSPTLPRLHQEHKTALFPKWKQGRFLLGSKTPVIENSVSYLDHEE